MKNYKISLEILTPVFIGNGLQITKKDFELKDDKAYVYDPIKLYSTLGILYESFLMNNANLTDYLNRMRYQNHLKINQAVKYKLYCGETGIRKNDLIHEFIKDPYGYPYIPGSSIKGTIRTALLAKKIKEGPINKFALYKREAIDKWEGAKRIEEEAFGKITDNDFRYLKISDSLPLSVDDLTLSKKIDIFKDGESNNKLNVCRETLRPGTRVTFNLTVDKENKYTPEDIMDAIQMFAKQYRTSYISKFNSSKGRQYGDRIIYLGGGTGFLTKTINRSLYGDETLQKVSKYLRKRFPRHRHEKDIALGLSPRAKKCTMYKNEIVEMGICRIGID